MDTIDVVKTLLVPGSTGFLWIGLTAGWILVIIGPRVRRWGVGLLGGLAILYWALALPLTSSALARSLEGEAQPLSTVDADQVVIIVFGGGSRTFRARGMQVSSPSEATALRALEGARLFHLANDAIVIASGGPPGPAGLGEPESAVIRRLLMSNGVPGDRIREESSSSSTREEVVLLAGLLQEMGERQVIAVSSPTHMQRVLGALAKEGVHARGSPSLEFSETRQPSPWYSPTEQALEDSRQVLREWMALVYYAARGWLGATGESAGA